MNLYKSQLKKKDSKQVTYFDIQWHRINLVIPNGRDGSKAKKDWDKARPKSRWADAEPCSFVPGIWARLPWQSFPLVLPTWGTRGPSLALSLLCVKLSMGWKVWAAPISQVSTAIETSSSLSHSVASLGLPLGTSILLHLAKSWQLSGTWAQASMVL